MMLVLISAVLFFALVPGVVVSLPSKGPLMTKAAAHALVFGLVFYFVTQMYTSEHYMRYVGPNDPCPNGTYQVGPVRWGRKTCQKGQSPEQLQEARGKCEAVENLQWDQGTQKCYYGSQRKSPIDTNSL